MHELVFTKPFSKDLAKLIKAHKLSETRVAKILQLLSIDPFNQSLRTHKVDSKNYGLAWSSRLTPDLRIIWKFEDDKVKILLLDIGGHSGKHKVYK